LRVRTKAEATRLFNTLTIPQHLPINQPAVTLASFFTILAQRLESVIRPKTIGSYGIAVKSFTNLMGEMLLKDITINDMELYKSRLLSRKVRPVSVNVYLRSLKAIFQRVEKWEYLHTNVMKKVELLRIPQREVTYLSKDSFKTLLSVISDNQLKDVITVACYTGCRLGELANLQFQYIDLNSSTLKIANTDIFETKSGKERVIPMVSIVKNIILKRESLKGQSEYVFHKNERPLTQNYISRNFKRGVRKAGLSERLHFHSTRHTAASWMLMAGIGIHTVKEILGHSSTELIDKVYGHLSDRYKQSEMSKLERI